jgi:molybdate transport system substrate-binding protein
MLMRALMLSGLALSLATSYAQATDKLTVMTSGGFSLAYREVLPEFERSSGMAVTTLSGASQGTGPKTIKSQLENGVDTDIVILSEEGLRELIAAGRILEGSEVKLATAALGAAVRRGSPKPDIGSVEALTKTLLAAKLLVMPGSTSGLFMKNTVLPRFGISDKVPTKLVARGAEATAMLAAGEADLAIGPISELVNQPGVDVVGALPDEVQLVQIFTSAIVKTSQRADEAKRLMQFLASDQTAAAIKKAGMGRAADFHKK